MLPGTSFVFQGEIVPNAPADMYAALGKNDQKIYVVPSENMVVVRMGNTAGLSLFAVSNFDNELWARISNLECTTGITEQAANNKATIYPNPATNSLTISFNKPLAKSFVLELYSYSGELIYGEVLVEGSTNYQLNIGTQPSGIYIYKVQTEKGYITGKVVLK
jgi:hypothetical protein